jgi:5-methylcytosine-specific restriction endonuclease McrA
MRIEIILFVITGAIIANIYYEGTLIKKLMVYKKYYKMAGIVIGALTVYYILKYNPAKAKQILCSSNEYLKYVPIDKGTSSMISPILDFTKNQNWGGEFESATTPVLGFPNRVAPRQPDKYRQSSESNYAKVKRSVSETKKKFVASRQNWHCGNCNNILNHTFEIDHILSLNNGGSNHVDNLVALCPACHREKTAMENMESQI